MLFQLEELWSNYGDYAEIWWDGGIDECNSAFAAKVDGLKNKLIGNVSAFGGDEPNAVRWIGTESGHPDCPPTSGLWSSTPKVQGFYTNDCGAPNGTVWAPAESDTCIRTAAPSGPHTGSCGCWSWLPNTSSTTKSPSELQSAYLQTVGNNANLLLNMAPDRRGLVPDSDMAAYHSLGSWVRMTAFISRSILPLAEPTALDCRSTPRSGRLRASAPRRHSAGTPRPSRLQPSRSGRRARSC